MIGDADLFVALAEIAGVFVGLGALISVTRRGNAATSDRVQIRGVVLTGLLVVASALIPVGLERYALEPEEMWRVASIALLFLIRDVFLVPLRDPVDRNEFLARFKDEPMGFVVLLCLEIAVQGPLVAVILGSFPASSAALYTTALVIDLLQAAFLLCQLVLSRPNESVELLARCPARRCSGRAPG